MTKYATILLCCFLAQTTADLLQDNSGTIERDEFLALPQISSNPLATRMIAIFDEDGGGDVDFQEFVGGLSAFSSRGGREEKLKCTSNAQSP